MNYVLYGFWYAIKANFLVFASVSLLSLLIFTLVRSKGRMSGVLRIAFSRRPCPVLWVRNRMDLARFPRRRGSDPLEASYIILDMESLLADVNGEVEPEVMRGHYGGELAGRTDEGKSCEKGSLLRREFVT